MSCDILGTIKNKKQLWGYCLTFCLFVVVFFVTVKICVRFHWKYTGHGWREWGRGGVDSGLRTVHHDPAYSGWTQLTLNAALLSVTHLSLSQSVHGITVLLQTATTWPLTPRARPWTPREEATATTVTWATSSRPVTLTGPDSSTSMSWPTPARTCPRRSCERSSPCWTRTATDASAPRSSPRASRRSRRPWRWRTVRRSGNVCAVTPSGPPRTWTSSAEGADVGKGASRWRRCTLEGWTKDCAPCPGEYRVLTFSVTACFLRLHCRPPCFRSNCLCFWIQTNKQTNKQTSLCFWTQTNKQTTTTTNNNNKRERKVGVLLLMKLLVVTL